MDPPGNNANAVPANAATRQTLSNLPPMELLMGRENWADWKFAVQTLLEVEGLWDAVEPEEGAVVDPAKDKLARGRIILMVHKSNFHHMKETKTAKQAWSKLVAAFEDSGLTRRMALINKLTSTKLETSESMQAFVSDIVEAAHQLRGIGFDVTDEWIGSFLLNGLPASYRPMIMALENCGSRITGDLVKTKLLQEVSVPSEGAAFSSKKSHKKPTKSHQNHPPSSQPSTSKGPKCRRCQNYGHIARDCQMKEPKKDTSAWCTVLSAQDVEDDNWYFDSGASNHFSKSDATLEDLRQCGGTVVAANRGAMKVVAKGRMQITPKCRPESPIVVNDVQVIPELSSNLLSVNQIVKRGCTVIFNSDGVKVRNSDGDVIATGTRHRDLFKLELRQQDTKSGLACSSAVGLDIWHQRLGHLNMPSVRKLASGLVDGIKIVGADPDDCKVCPMGKHSRQPFSKKGSRATEVLDVVHTDICGPFEVASIGGSRYYILFVDDRSRKMWVFFLKTKSEEEVLRTFKEFHVMVERQSERKLKVLRSDNGKEFVNNGLRSYLKQHGIVHQTTTPYTPEQNGMAERGNRSIVERARCLLFGAGMEKRFWAEAVGTAVYLLNRSPTQGHDSTPEEVWTRKKPDLSHLRIFGTKVMVQIPKQKRRKLDPKSHECIFVGYDEHVKGYRLYDPQSRKVFVSREVRFINEGVLEKPEDQRKDQVVRLDFEPYVAPTASGSTNRSAEIDDATENELENPDTDGVSDDGEDEFFGFEQTADSVTDVTSVLPPQKSSNPPQSPVLRRSGREHKLPGKYADFYVPTRGLPRSNPLQEVDPSDTSDDDSEDNSSEESDDPVPPSRDTSCVVATARSLPVNGDPVSHRDALSREDSASWKKAMVDEYEALMANDTWTLTELPKGRKAIKCRWVFKTKHDASGNVDRHKARLVVKGFSQRKGEDYDETYSPVVRHSSLRYLFALSARYDLSMDQMDATTAFLQSELEEEIFMEQPPCFEDPTRRNLVCRLNKALYGLKQSSRVWNGKLDAALKRFGLHSSKYDPCLYNRISNGKILFVAIYVDDVVIVSNDEAMKNEIKAKLSSTFRMKDLGPISSCLGIRVTREEGCVALDQQAYIESMLNRFNMQNAKPVSTPSNPPVELAKEMAPKTPDEAEKMKRVPYPEAVGSLMYLATCTRPDIMHAVNQLSRFNANPGPKHWEAVKHLFRYLRGTAGLKLRYRKQGNTELVGYTDASWASDLDDRKSTSGYIFMLQGGAVAWSCKRQPTVALSTCEAEYMALAATVQEASWWHGLLAQFGQKRPIELRCDNQSAICIARNGSYTPRTKHIDIRHHYIRDALDKKIVALSYVSTDEQTADGLTKSLERIKLDRNRAAMGISGSA